MFQFKLCCKNWDSKGAMPPVWTMLTAPTAQSIVTKRRIFCASRKNVRLSEDFGDGVLPFGQCVFWDGVPNIPYLLYIRRQL